MPKYNPNAKHKYPGAPIGFTTVSEKTLAERPFYSVLTNKGKDHRKNTLRTGTYPTKKEARDNVLGLAQKYDMNIKVFDLRNRRKSK
jgi:hypothetical protein